MNDYTDIGMTKCNNEACPSHKAWHRLREVGLAYTIKCKNGVIIETTESPWTDNAYDKVKAHFTTNGITNHKAMYKYIESTMRPLEKLHASMFEMNWYRRQTGRIGYLVEKQVPDVGKLHEVESIYRKDSAYTCPYCGSPDVQWDTGKKETKYYDYKELEDTEVPMGDVVVKRRDPRTNEWYNEVVDITPNDECDYDTEYEDIMGEVANV